MTRLFISTREFNLMRRLTPKINFTTLPITWVTVCHGSSCDVWLEETFYHLNLFWLARLPFSWYLGWREQGFVEKSHFSVPIAWRKFLLMSCPNPQNLTVECLMWEIVALLKLRQRFFPKQTSSYRLKKHISWALRDICLLSVLPELIWIAQ